MVTQALSSSCYGAGGLQAHPPVPTRRSSDLDYKDPFPAAVGFRPEKADGHGKASREGGNRHHPGYPGHPSNLKTDKVSEGFPRVHISATGLFEVAGGFGKTENQKGNGEAGQKDRPDTHHPQQEIGRAHV